MDRDTCVGCGHMSVDRVRGKWELSAAWPFLSRPEVALFRCNAVPGQPVLRRASRAAADGSFAVPPACHDPRHPDARTQPFGFQPAAAGEAVPGVAGAE